MGTISKEEAPKTTMEVPPKQLAQSKAQLKRLFTRFLRLYEKYHTNYGQEINVVAGHWRKTILLKSLAGNGADSSQANTLQMVGARKSI